MSFFHRDRAFTTLASLVEKEKDHDVILEGSPGMADEPHGRHSIGDGDAADDEIEDFILVDEISDDNNGGFLNTSSDEKNTLLTETLPIPATKFFKLFFSDASEPFTMLYHKDRGDTDVTIKPWTTHAQFGTIRTIQYRAPVKSPIGPPITRCEETQRYQLTRTRFSMEVIGVYYDIPFGDTFRVEGRWEVNTSADGKSCTLVAGVCVNWLKKTWFKGKIESGTLKESKESYEMWFNLAKKHISQNRNLLSPSISINPPEETAAEPIAPLKKPKKKFDTRIIIASSFFLLLGIWHCWDFGRVFPSSFLP